MLYLYNAMYDNKYVGLVLKDSREKQQDRKREEVQGESRFVTKRAQQGGGAVRLDRPHDSESHIIM